MASSPPSSPRGSPRAKVGAKEQQRRMNLVSHPRNAVPLIGNLAEPQLRKVAIASEPVVFRPGQTIIEHGDASGDLTMYIVERGHPMAWDPDIGLVARYTPGSYFGEMAALRATLPNDDGAEPVAGKRMATVAVSKTGKEVTCLMVPHQAVIDVLKLYSQVRPCNAPQPQPIPCSLSGHYSGCFFWLRGVAVVW
jgi:CRP-like cAMP-binding protein